MLSKITSPVNARVKQLVRLRKGPERRKAGVILVDGLREILRARDAGLTCLELYVLQGSSGSPETGSLPAPVELVPDVFEKVSYGDRDDGWIAVFREPDAPATLPVSRQGLYLVLDHLEKPGNIGAILRTADAAGVTGVLVCDSPTDIYNPNIIRASTGTVFSLPMAPWPKERALDFLKSANVNICVADPRAKDVYTRADLSSAIALVVGQEDVGVSDFWMRRADVKVRIPMNGRADSLNVSISAAVILYEAVRQRSV